MANNDSRIQAAIEVYRDGAKRYGESRGILADEMFAALSGDYNRTLPASEKPNTPPVKGPRSSYWQEHNL
jgi:hypothetical protein